MLFRSVCLIGFVFVVLAVASNPMALAEDASNGATAVLASCNSSVEIQLASNPTEERVIRIIQLNKWHDGDCARVKLRYPDQTSRESNEKLCGTKELTVPKNKTFYAKITNIEKGKEGNNCNGGGPNDGDVRVCIPKGATVTFSGVTTSNKCDVCKASFDPPKKIFASEAEAIDVCK
jgi:hypothetical protein